MEQYEQLFKAVSQIVQQAKVAKEESRLRGEQFNIFKVCGIDHYELQHSAIIAELLNPHGSHGQGCLYLKQFMETYGSSINISTMDEKNIHVRREEWTSDYDGRMDIYVEYDTRPFLIIENKLYASDQSIQLKRYDRDAQQREAREYEIVYLTLDGKDASEDSGEGVAYFRMSYSKDIIKWLDVCIEHSSRIPLVRETLVQYQNHIKQLTYQDMNELSKKELFEIMIKNHEEVDSIIQASNDGYFDFLFERFVKPDLQKFATANEFIYIEPLLFTKKDWHDAKISIDTNHVGCYCGIVYDSEKEIQKSIWTNGGTPWWPYGWFYGDLFYKWKEPALYSSIIRGQFSKEVIKIVKKVMADLKNNKIDLSETNNDNK